MAAVERLLLIFAKAPEAGRVKTRMIPRLGGPGAAALHRLLMLRTLRRLAGGAWRSRLLCAPDCDHDWFRQRAHDFALSLAPQEGMDLGERMLAALEHGLAESPAVVIVGTDCPSLDVALVEAAFQALEQGEDVVLAPAEDGGYVLIGARRGHRRLFEDVAWGSDQVMALSRTRLRELGWRWRELAPQWDVDRPADLSRLLAGG